MVQNATDEESSDHDEDPAQHHPIITFKALNSAE